MPSRIRHARVGGHPTSRNWVHETLVVRALVDSPTTTDCLCVARLATKPVSCLSVEGPSQSGSDDLAGPESGPADVPGPRSKPGVTPDNSVTMIMPVIAPWPEPGAEPPVVDVGTTSDNEPIDVPQTLDAPDTHGSALVPARRSSIGLIRPGPGVIADDSWDDPQVPVLARAFGRARRVRLPSRVLVTVVAVLIGLGAIAAVPFALRSEPEAAPDAAPRQVPTGLDERQPVLIPGSTEAQSPTSMPTGASATPARTSRPARAQAGNPATEKRPALGAG